jgi:malate synthase
VNETLVSDRVADRPASVAGARHPRTAEVLSADALDFLAALHRRFDAGRKALLEARVERQTRLDAGEVPDFRADSADLRAAEWRVAPAPADLTDRRVEITGPTNAKMVINALNSGAKVFMADFEDATAPAIDTLIDGQSNLIDRWRGTLGFDDPATGKNYRLAADPAVLIVRPRGLHLDESHVTVDGAPVSGSLFDFGLYLFHNAKAAIAAGSGPYYYLPKLEGGAEAEYWSEVIAFAEAALDLPHGTVRVTLLIETLPAAFEMDEMLFALKDHVVGLNCGRWDYIFSFIKRFGRTPDRLVPDRSAMTMDRAFLAAYSLRLIATCHRRGAHAMGGMAAAIPVKDDEAANAAAFERVAADKRREVGNGHDGTWVAHPALVPVALDAFAVMEGPNQLGVIPAVFPERDALLELHSGPRTEAGAREAIRVGVQYLAAWIGGRGAVPLYGLMEDAATAEICRMLLWQWRRFEAPLDDGRRFDEALFAALLGEEVARLPAIAHRDEAVALFGQLVRADQPVEFLTLPAQSMLDAAALG